LSYRIERVGIEAARAEAQEAAAMRASHVARAQARLRKLALGYPEAWEDHPWGETVVKVRTRVFLFLGRADGGLSLSVKLPDSATFALGLPFATPTGYGLGKSGWITARFEPGERPPLEILERWLDESYRAVAPKKLVASLGIPGPGAESRAAAPGAAGRRIPSRR
jgi:predicted DNA-binding protein (MmcQ/YjbR family)